MGPIISVFILVLVISILSGLTFLFVSQLKMQTANTAAVTVTVANQTDGIINNEGYTLVSDSLAKDFVIIEARDDAGDEILAANYTVDTNTGVVSNLTALVWTDVQFDYSYYSPSGTTAYTAVNKTESSGATVVDYLPLIFLAIIFGALLTLVLKIILPYINLGRSVEGF